MYVQWDQFSTHASQGMDEKWFINCPKIDEKHKAHYQSSSCNAVCKKTPRVLFLPRVRYVLGNSLLKFLLVKAYGNKVQLVCLVVVGLGSPLQLLLGSKAAVKFHIQGFDILGSWVTQVCCILHNLTSPAQTCREPQDFCMAAMIAVFFMFGLEKQMLSL